jgi:hypothetical protein
MTDEVSRDELRRRFAALQESIPGVRAARRTSTIASFGAAILLVGLVVLLGRRRRDRRA